MAKHMARTKQTHGKSMPRVWQEHGNNMSLTWQWHGKSMAITWQDHGKTRARPWQDQSKSMAITWQSPSKSIATHKRTPEIIEVKLHLHSSSSDPSVRESFNEVAFRTSTLKLARKGFSVSFATRQRTNVSRNINMFLTSGASPLT
jgi:ABC-type glutathione transport system ATPase component